MQNAFLNLSIRRKKRKNIGLVLLLAILTFVLIGGSLFILLLQNGLKGMEKRLGADIMVVPADCEKSAESILLEGSREYFYFDQSVADRIKGIDGIKSLTEQFYLASLSTDCCSSQVGIVGFHMDSDFIIQPWIDEKDKARMGFGKAIAGSQIQVGEDHTIKLFGREYPVVSTLASTGTSMDTSVYFTMDTVPQLMEDAEAKGIRFLDSQKKECTISSVFINMEEGTTERDIARQISALEMEDVDILYPDSILKDFAGNTGHMVNVTYIILAAAWLVVELLLFAICYISSRGDSKEYALLRVLGLSGKQLMGMAVKESLVLALGGFAVGGFFSALLVLPFGRYLAIIMKTAYLTPRVGEVLGIFAVGLVILVLSSMIASVIPVARLCKPELYTVLREEE